MTQAMLSQLRDDVATIRSWSQGSSGVSLAEVDTINVIVGDGVTALAPGVSGAIRVDFNSVITGCFLQEFDGVTGSVSIDIEKATGGSAPGWASMIGPSAPAIIAGRYFEDPSCATWSERDISRGQYLRFLIASAISIARVHIGLRIRRLEP